MIQSNNATILVLSIPRTGTWFTHHFLFEAEGRVVPVSADMWLSGTNPISYTPDRCLIVEHFHPERMPLIEQVLNSGEDVRVVVPMRDLLASASSAALMNHKGFIPGIDAYLQTIDSIPHHDFLFSGDNLNKRLNDLLTYCGVTKHTKRSKYLTAKINSIRPDTTPELNLPAFLLQQRYDRIQTAMAVRDLSAVRNEMPGEYDDFAVRMESLKPKMLSAGYNQGDLSWM